jgi:hypothetical protein
MLPRSKRLKIVKLKRLRKLEHHIGSASLVGIFMKATNHLTSVPSALLQKALLCHVNTTKRIKRGKERR